VKIILASTLAVLVLTGCVTTTINTPPAKPVPPPPPTPDPRMVAMVRPTTRHYAALSATVEAASIVDTNAPGYGVIGRFPIEHEDGSKTFGVFMQWDNWTTNAYTIQRSKDFINWETVVTSTIQRTFNSTGSARKRVPEHRG
jgi:hypothetical protein